MNLETDELFLNVSNNDEDLTATSKRLNSELRVLCLYRSFLYSRVALSVTLVTGYFLFAFIGNGSRIPIYLVIFFNLLPLMLIISQRNRVISDSSFLLSSLKNQYHYSRSSYRNQVITFSFTNCVLIVWQFYIPVDGTPLTLFPLAAFLIGVLSRLAGFIFSLLSSKRKLMHGKI